MDPHDIELVKALVAEGLTLEVIAEKFEVEVSDLVPHFIPEPFKVGPMLYRFRISNGFMQREGVVLKKWCPRCEQFLPLNKNYWKTNRRTPDNSSFYCRVCEAQRMVAQRLKRKLENKPCY